MEFPSDESGDFVKTILPHYDYLRRFIFTITESEHLTMDIVQDTMLIAWQNLEQVKNYKNVRNGLVSIAKHALADYYRKHRRDMECLSLDRVNTNHLIEKDIAEVLIELEHKSEFFADINVLKGNQLKIILLYYYFDMPMKEIARVLRVNYNTAVSLHRRALTKMRKKYEGKYSEFIRSMIGGEHA